MKVLVIWTDVAVPAPVVPVEITTSESLKVKVIKKLCYVHNQLQITLES